MSPTVSCNIVFTEVAVTITSIQSIILIPDAWELPNLVVSNLAFVNLRRSTFLCSFAFALLCSHLCSFALFSVFLRPTAFRTTAFGNFREAINTPDLVTRPKYPSLSRDRCSNTPVALCFLWYRSRLSLLHPTSFHKNGLSQSKDRPN